MTRATSWAIKAKKMRNLLVIEEEAFDELGLADGRVAAQYEFEIASLHLLRLTNSLIEYLFVVVSSQRLRHFCCSLTLILDANQFDYYSSVPQ